MKCDGVRNLSVIKVLFFRQKITVGKTKVAYFSCEAPRIAVSGDIPRLVWSEKGYYLPVHAAPPLIRATPSHPLFWDPS